MKRCLLPFFVAGILLFLLPEAVAQPPKEMAKGFKSDVRYYFRKVRRLHPDPYLTVSRDSLRKRKRQLLQACDTIDTMLRFNVLMMQCNCYFDRHSGVFHSDFEPCDPIVGLEVRQDSLFCSYSGEQVLKVGDADASDFVKTVKNFIPNDIYGEKFQHYFAYYTGFYFLLKEVEYPDSLLLYRPQDGAVYKGWCTLPEEHIRPRSSGKSKDYEWTIFPKDSIAVLVYNTCFVKNVDLFRDTLQVFFDSLKQEGIKYLCIDVRRNGGGNNMVNDIILKHLKINPYKFEYVEKARRWARIAFNRFYMGDDFPYKEIRPWSERELKWKNSWMAITPFFRKRHICRETIKEHDGFPGQIFVLQGGNTYSAAVDLALDLRLCSNALLVGDSYGVRNPSTGNIFYLTLPYSKIKVVCPSQSYYYKYDLPEKDGFLLPDLPFQFQDDAKVSLEEMKAIIKQAAQLKEK